MANTKISALTSSTTPLAGTEVLPIVQSSATVKVAVSDLTAGRSVSASSFVPTGSTIPANGLYLPAANSVGIATNTTNVIYINSSGNVGLNQPIPTVKWDIVGNGGIVSKFQNYAGSAGIDSYVAEGTSAAPTALLSGRQIMNYRNFGYDGASYIFVGSIDMQAESAFSVGVNPTYIRFRTSPSSGGGREVFRMDSVGNALVKGSGTGSLGYGSGTGGTVTQGTSRTTGVTLSKPTGAITMFSALGSAVAATFTVTNTLVASTDTIILNQQSGTNLYVLLVTAVAAGSFNITFYTTGGVATDAPVINFSIIKGVTA